MFQLFASLDFTPWVLSCRINRSQQVVFSCSKENFALAAQPGVDVR